MSSGYGQPDLLPNYNLRSIPTVFAGVNSRGSAGSNFFAQNQPDPRVQDWNLTLEREVMANTIARVTYVGNHGQNLEQVYVFNDSTPDYIWYATTGLALPTGEYSSVARRPFDQQVYGSLREWRKTGWSNFNGLQMELERRYSKGWGYQLFYVMGNAFAAGALAGGIAAGDLALHQGTAQHYAGRREQLDQTLAALPQGQLGNLPTHKPPATIECE